MINNCNTIRKYNPDGKHTRHSARCKGAAAVEAALIIPMVIVLTLGAIDIAQYINLAQIVTNTSREGARIASRITTTTVDEVEESVKSYLGSTFPNMSQQDLDAVVSVEVRDKNGQEIENDLTEINSADPFSIRVAFDFSQIRWIPGPEYFGGTTNVSVTMCRRE